MDRIVVTWIVWFVAGLAIEVWALSDQVPGNTLSEIVWNVTKSYPLVAVAFGFLGGHFFWQRAGPAITRMLFR